VVCRRPVRRLNRVLLPELGFPIIAMDVFARRRIPILLIGTWTAEGSAILEDRGNAEVTGLLFANGNSSAEHRHFHRVATYGGILELYFGALNEPEHHEAHNSWLSGVHFGDAG